MKPKKFRDIALLMVPIVALALIMPGARLVDNWRESRELQAPTRPHIQTFELRAPTAWEAYQGVEVAFTSRVLTPSWRIGHHWRPILEISNDKGQKWSRDKPIWKSVVFAEDDSVNATSKTRTVKQIRGGLRWDKIAGQGGSVHAKIILEKQTDTATIPMIKNDTERAFVWRKPVAPVSLNTLRQSNFQIEKIKLQSWKNPTFVHHRLSIFVRPSKPIIGKLMPTAWKGLWDVRVNSRPIGEEPVWTFDSPSTHQTDESGLILMEADLEEDESFFRDKPAHISGLLSVDDGWPQKIRIDLPQGLPSNDNDVESNPTFTAKLAPLPK